MVKGLNANAYVQAQVGMGRNPLNEAYLNAGIAAGGIVNFKGTYLNAEGGIGTALSGKAELGHNFDISENIGLNLSAKAQATKSLLGPNTHNITVHNDGEGECVITDNHGLNEHVKQNDYQTVSYKWSTGEIRFGAGAQATWKPSEKVKLGLGVEGGMRKTLYNSNIKTRTAFYTTDNNIKPEAVYDDETERSKNTGYITPTASAEVKLNNKFSFVANADMYQGQAGIRYTF